MGGHSSSLDQGAPLAPPTKAVGRSHMECPACMPSSHSRSLPCDWPHCGNQGLIDRLPAVARADARVVMVPEFSNEGSSFANISPLPAVPLGSHVRATGAPAKGAEVGGIGGDAPCRGGGSDAQTGDKLGSETDVRALALQMAAVHEAVVASLQSELRQLREQVVVTETSEAAGNVGPTGSTISKLRQLREQAVMAESIEAGGNVGSMDSTVSTVNDPCPASPSEPPKRRRCGRRTRISFAGVARVDVSRTKSDTSCINEQDNGSCGAAGSEFKSVLPALSHTKEGTSRRPPAGNSRPLQSAIADSAQVVESGTSMSGDRSHVEFSLYKHWQETASRPATSKRILSPGATNYLSPKTMRFRPEGVSTMTDFPSETVERRPSCSKRMMAKPGSKRRAPWDIMGMALVLYDAVVIPLGTFQVPSTPGLIAMEWATRFYWTADIPLTFTCGYFKNGEVVMNPARVARNYFATTFTLDATIVVMDWVVGVGTADAIFSGRAGILRIFRAARILRLLRLFKLQKIVMFAQDHMNSEYTALVFDFVKLVFSVILLSHFAACIFWWIGTQGSVSQSWIYDNDLHGRTIEVQYLASLHVSLMTFLMEVVVMPQNTSEYVFCILTVILGLILFSTIISRITSLLLELQKVSADTTQELWRLRRYFRQKRVPIDLSRRITRYLEYHHDQQRQSIQWSDLPLLNNLTPVLRNQLRYVGLMQSLREHPLYRFIEHVSDVTMHRICENAVTEKALAETDPLFFQGEVGVAMEVLERGSLLYAQHQGNGKSQTFDLDRLEDMLADAENHTCNDAEGRDPGKSIRKRVNKGTILSESALWVPWRHFGDAYALTECNVISVDVDTFGEMVKRSSYIHSSLRKYAIRALKLLDKMQSRDMLNDIWNKERTESILNSAVKDMMNSSDVMKPNSSYDMDENDTSVLAS